MYIEIIYFDAKNIFCMQIPAIKSALSLEMVLAHYGLTPDRNHRLLCPWHDDKVPSLQLYLETDTWTCFSSKCDAGSGDVIDFIMRYEGITKHEAILKSKVLLGNVAMTSAHQRMATNYEAVFNQLKGNLKKSSRARAYLEGRGLDASSPRLRQAGIGYNARGWEYLKHCVVFALRDADGQVVSLYGRSIYDDQDMRHYYLKNRTGLYPCWPAREATHLVLTESVIDAATLIQLTDYPILALYGTNGLTADHEKALQGLADLQELTLFLDGDEAGKAAQDKLAKKLQALRPDVKLSVVATPAGEDVNSLLDSHEPEILTHLIESRKLLHSIEEKSNDLDTSRPYDLRYSGLAADYSVKGGLGKNGYESMKITLVIADRETGRKVRNKIDLYEYRQVEKLSVEASERLGLNESEIEKDVERLTDLLDEYREEKQVKQEQEIQTTYVLTVEERKSCEAFLKKGEVVRRLNKLIGKYGVVGEEGSRIFLFVIASAHRSSEPLHALVQGSSGSGKTHLLKQITDLLPPEDVIRLTRVTEGSFYNYGEYELSGKLLVIEDYDGLKEEAEYAFRELQSSGELISSTSSADARTGEVKARIKRVRGPIGSLAATTRGEVYEDNLSRCFVVAVDESEAQTLRIIAHQNERASGKVDRSKQEQIKGFIRNCVRLMKPLEVVNPYADKLSLPREAFKLRRLNANFHAFVKQVTVLNQYRRKRDTQGRLLTEKEDIELALDILLDGIVLKVDELDGSLRTFYERLKNYIKREAEKREEVIKLIEFGQREVRHALRISKTQLQRYIQSLLELEYIRVSGGHANRGYKYQVCYWDDQKRLKQRIQAHLRAQLSKIE